MMTDQFASWVTVVPAKGEESTTAKALLRLASSPLMVRTAEGGSVFVVAPEVAGAYQSQESPTPRKRAPKKKEGEG